MTRRRAVMSLLALVILAGVTRFAHLDADPARFKRLDELADEGYWAHNARAAALFGTLFPDDLAQGPGSAPLFHWTLSAVFAAAGVSYTAARVGSAAASTLLVPAVYLIARPELGPRGALVAALLVLLNHELFAFGRLGLPEALHVLLAVLGAGLWIHRRSRAGALGAGVLLGLSLLAKLNVLVVGGLAGVWLLERLRARPLTRDLLAFGAGLAVVLLPWLVFYHRPHAELFALNHLALNRDRVAMQPGDLGRLPLHFMANPFWGLPSTWALLPASGLVVAGLVRAGRAWRVALAALTRVEMLALGWLCGITLPTAIFVRAVGERRILVLVVPLVLLGAAALTRAPRVPASERPAPAPRGLAWCAVVVWTLAGLALWFSSGYGRALKVGVVVAAAVGSVVLGVLATRLARRGVLDRRRALGAIAAGLGLLPCISLGRFVAWLLQTAPPTSTITTGVVASVALIAAVRVVAAERRGPRLGQALVVASLAYGVLAIGVNLWWPTFTLREASRRIDALVGPGAAITGAFAHQLSFENRTLPIWYTPRRAYNNLLNPDLRRFDVRAALMLPEPSRFFPNPEDLPFALEPRARFELYPAPQGLGPAAPAPKAAVVLYGVR